jgi:hypothetical protein
VRILGDREDAPLVQFGDLLDRQAGEQAEVVPGDGRLPAPLPELALPAVLVQDHLGDGPLVADLLDLADDGSCLVHERPEVYPRRGELAPVDDLAPGGLGPLHDGQHDPLERQEQLVLPRDLLVADEQDRGVPLLAGCRVRVPLQGVDAAGQPAHGSGCVHDGGRPLPDGVGQ